MRLFSRLRGSASCLTLVAVASVAQAQEATSPAPASAEPESVDEIVVTAQRREESLQDVPLVVSAVSEATLEAAGVRDIKDLQVVVPGLIVASTANEVATTARVRGVGTVGDNPGLESSVGVTIDGVYRPRNGVAFNDLGELSRIEVLKGPQGTLFGRNTSAGVINVITKAPSFTFAAEGEFTVGNYGQRGAAVSVTGPLDDRGFAAGRVYAARRVRDGVYEVRTGEGPRTRTDDQNLDMTTVRGQLLFDLDADTRLRLIADYTERDESCCVGVQLRTGPTAARIDALAGGEGLADPARPFARIGYANRGTEQRITDGGVSAELNAGLRLGGAEATLTSITAYRTWDSVLAQDADFSTADIVFRPADGSYGAAFETFTQEVRLAGELGRVDYLVGGFFVDEQLRRTDGFLYGADYEANLGLLFSGGTNPALISALTGLPVGRSFAAGEGQRDVYDQDTQSLAVFTHNIVGLTDRFDLSLGLRYTTETKQVFSTFENTDGGRGCAAALARAPFSPAVARTVPTLCLPFSNPGFNGRTTTQERDESELSGTGKLSFRPSEDLLLYASYARGYKSGGFNLDRSISADGLPTGAPGVVPVRDTSFAPEFVDSWEAGVKSTLLNGRLLLNATAFHQLFEDFQLNTFLGTTFVVESIPEVTSDGVDADFIYLTPVDGLSLQGGLTYADTRYGEFRPEDLSNPARFFPLQLLPGERLSFAPEVSLTGSVSYERPVGGLLARLFLGAKYNSEYNTGSDLLPFKTQEAFTLVNGRVGLGTRDDRVRLELFAQNLTDAEYVQVAFNQFFQGGAFATPNFAAGQLFVPYDQAADTVTYGAFLGAPRTYGLTLRVRF